MMKKRDWRVNQIQSSLPYQTLTSRSFRFILIITRLIAPVVILIIISFSAYDLEATQFTRRLHSPASTRSILKASILVAFRTNEEFANYVSIPRFIEN